jgi:two-component system cell cycle sensor histidine kinase/response regulator CckA
MSIPNILILEDNDSDAELVEHELHRANIQFVSTRVADRERFLEQIVNRPPDIILSDYSLPQFDGLEALRIVKEHNCEAPFILVTGSQTEEVAVECMKQGAADYMLKSNILRLPSAVLNALKRRESEKEKAKALEALRQSEEQLRMSQKLEAIGQLAGGVAHDFNNLLTVITGYSELLLRRAVPEDPNVSKIAQIHKAAERAASLTRQLLAFSRKQVLQPKVFDLNTLVADMTKMARRLISEDVKLVVALARTAVHINADPGQMEQVLMNLVVNARDAIPDGGAITIETSIVEIDQAYADMHVAVKPGTYAMLAVTDNGCGIDAETTKHIFEPFFTTKELGKGTGLGLSTVYGIVKQSGGNIWLYSEPGIGSTFKVYVPLVQRRAEEVKSSDRRAALPPGIESVLLVEDEAQIRDMVRGFLHECGYAVLVAADGEEALRILEQYDERIHLVITDVVMPRMNGAELAKQVRLLSPATKILYMSGYTDNAIVRHGVLEPGMAFIEKPFTPALLAQKIRDLLDRRVAAVEV